MNQQDPTSLDNFVDIVAAEPISWWPPAVGWWFVIAIVAIWSVVYPVLRIKRWMKDRYRREALELLQQIESDSPKGQVPALVQVDSLLKRVALAAYPRDRVASLSGNQWVKFLADSGNDQAFQQEPAVRLATAASDVEPAEISQQQWKQLLSTCEKWIRNHSPEAPAC